MHGPGTPDGYVVAIAFSCAVAASIILVVFLVRPRPLSGATKVWLLFGIGVLPVAAALTGNIAGYEASKEQEFCGSCHTMRPFVRDATDPESTSLAALHARNKLLADESCYQCHREYRRFGQLLTKVTGLHHLWAYATEYRTRGEEAAGDVRVYNPYANANCRYCHSTELPGFRDEPEHETVAEKIRTDAISCSAAGCHGPAHPVGATAREAQQREKDEAE